MQPAADDSPDLPEFQLVADSQGHAWAKLSGVWNLRALEPLLPGLEGTLSQRAKEASGWDLTGITALDHAGALLIWRAWGRRMVELLKARPEHTALFSQLELPDPTSLQPRRWRVGDPVRALGIGALSFIEHLQGFVVLLGQVALDVLRLARRPEGAPWKEISANLYRTGAQALGITALVGFLVGVVLSYLTAQQLRAFGADLYIVNLLGVAVIRELGPVLAAILVAGRSGSAMTAQIGVMRVTEELDALSVLGIPHTLRLVLPKMIALAIAMPLLILWTNAIALIGGMVSAQAQLGIDYRYFIMSLPAAVPIANLWLGLAKGFVFGIFIALVACHFGLRIKPNTESLGQGTTSSVVTATTLVILIDAIFAVMFSDVGSFV
ncbi:MAG: phospholipid/cholesterol/gamma-HCH transport system permease protein [Betaproteobacteria bacterium]|jgi:phospholipid/cholesterol/gamma-HCH transport system permease protein|nr:phospholipid/cholesterol/gamma-HCH transport system permease protein [Betaproteobacteria bacterium]